MPLRFISKRIRRYNRLSFRSVWSKGISNFFSEAWYWFKCNVFPQHRYHILDLRKGSDDYTHGWYETDQRMLQACFLLLKEYVEKEQPFKNIDWDHDDTTRAVAKEIGELYTWWTITRPIVKKQISREWAETKERIEFIKNEKGLYIISTPESHKKLIEAERNLQATEQRNLERLIKIRGHLWT